MKNVDSDVAVDHKHGMNPATLVRASDWYESGSERRKSILDYWDVAVVIALALVLWLPRLSGPIDLRWDAGVYYLLGTSLAEGNGYRVPSEPGAPRAVQYPPLLPAFVALHQRVLGTTDPAIVARWLRISGRGAVPRLCSSRACPCQKIAPARFCRGRLGDGPAPDHDHFSFRSALCRNSLRLGESVLFASAAISRRCASRLWLREGLLFALALVGFLLRTAGIALLATWVLEAIMRRQWRLTLVRGILALLPVILWQGYVAGVVRSPEYKHPVYSYQRASYQYYNVTYAENLLLIDSFRPELGRASVSGLAKRFTSNLVQIVPVFGEMVSTKRGYWLKPMHRLQRGFVKRSGVLPAAIWLLMMGYAVLVLAGIALLLRRRRWTMVFIILTSVALICTTPWPGQFTRYLAPLTPFLTICLVLSLASLSSWFWQGGYHRGAAVVRAMVMATIILAFAAESYAAARVFRDRHSKTAEVVGGRGNESHHRLFYHDQQWQSWEEAVEWIQQHSDPGAIVATSSPHWCYLRTGRRAVLPPMEADPTRARQLLEAIPVSFVIVDELGFVDISRRYAEPAMQSDPAGWRLVYANHKTRVFQHAAAPR